MPLTSLLGGGVGDTWEGRESPPSLDLGGHTCVTAQRPPISPGPELRGGRRGSKAHSKGANIKIDRQANRSDTTLQRGEEPQDEALRHSSPQTRGHKAPPCPGLGCSRHQVPAQSRAGPSGSTWPVIALCVLEHSEGLISAFNMQIRAWAD